MPQDDTDSLEEENENLTERLRKTELALSRARSAIRILKKAKMKKLLAVKAT